MKFLSYSTTELASLRMSGSILASVLQSVVDAVRPGVTTLELDALAERSIRERGGIPAFKNYHGYPASLCVSRNDEVVHGIPKATIVLVEGDVVGLDLGVAYSGMFTDMARSVGVGRISSKAQQLLDVTRTSLAAGLAAVQAGCKTGDIGAAVQAVAAAAGFGVVRDLVGHGVGRAVHEEPSIPNFGKAGSGQKIRQGMTLAIEPMLTVGDYAVRTDADGWTVRTVDGSLASHEERTVLVTPAGFELLTPVA